MELILIILAVIAYIMFGEFIYGATISDDDPCADDFMTEILFTAFWPVISIYIIVCLLACVLDKIFPRGPFGFMRDLGKKVQDKIWKWRKKK